MANSHKSFTNVTAATNAVTGVPNLTLVGFSAKNFHSSSTNSGFTLRSNGTNGSVVVHVNLAANESTRESTLNIDMSGKDIWIADPSGQFDVTIYHRTE